MAIGWQSSMETGAALVDAQHRAFVERADRLISVIEAGAEKTAVERAMREFGDYAVRHFSRDEECALRGSCPVLEWNGIARAEMIKIIGDFRSAYERDGASETVAGQLSDSMCAWVSKYIPGPEAASLPCVAAAK
ncbi:MAG TPA: hemerythrin domain-containing protein [Candidatus Limnocylindrales bacterium]|jgi:hemerythrin-like metal-binding protein